MTDTQNPFEKAQQAERMGSELPQENRPDEETERPKRPKRPTLKARPKTKKPVQQTKERRPQVGTSERKERIPVGLRAPRQTPTREGFYRRWVNDTEDRLFEYAQGGYTKVVDEHGKPRERRAGGGVTQYLLEIDKSLHDEDQQKKFDLWNKDAQERLKPREGQGYYTPKTKL